MDNKSLKFLYFFWVLLVLSSFCFTLGNQTSQTEWGTVIVKEGICEFTPGKQDNYHAIGYLGPMKEGFRELEIWTNDDYDWNTTSYAAGCVEGILTSEMTWDLFSNVKDFFFPNGTLQKPVLDFIEKQEQWVAMMYQEHHTDTYWKHVRFITRQRDGMIAGLTMSADLEDVAHATSVDVPPLFYRTPHCSAVLRLLPDSNDLLVGHATWFIYPAMIRLIKTYHMNLPDLDEVASSVIRMTSYPMALSSNDDFYVLSHGKVGMVVTETTNSVFNTTLYHKVVPQCILSWQRGIVANRMATSGETWTKIYTQHLSGTQNNQWIVIDFNLFVPRTELDENTVWIVETEPGYWENRDVSQRIAENGYFPSYNVPSIKKLYDDMGYPGEVEKHGGDMASYNDCCRAKIFKRDAVKVESYSALQNLIRYNDYQNDVFSKGNPEYSVDSRLDLGNVGPFGAVDSKVVGYRQLFESQTFEFSAQNGPSHDNLKPFDWKQYPDWAHQGIDDVVNNVWINSTMKTDV